MRVIFKTPFAAAFMLSFGMLTSYADCVCMRWKLDIPEVRGRVVAIDRSKPKEETPIAGAVIRLLKCIQIAGTPCQVVAETKSDESGFFTVEGVDAGKYMLDVGAARFQSLTIGTQVTGGSKGKKEIVVGLESERRCCAGRAEVRKVKSK